MKWLIIISLILFSSCSVIRKTESPKEVIRLDGSESYDPDGHIVSYKWRQIAGLPVRIENPAIGITYGSFKGRGVYKFELTVIDNDGAANKDTATVIKY